MSDLKAKRDQIAAVIARDQGLGDLAKLAPDVRAAIDRQTQETIEANRGAEVTEAPSELQRLLAQYRVLQADEANAILAEEGEVFAPEDDA